MTNSLELNSLNSLNSLSNSYNINTTNGATIPAGMVQISCDIRDTEKVKVDDNNRYRNILIKELSLPQVEDKLRPVLLDKLYSLAKEQFDDLMKSSNRMAREVNQTDYTVTGILSYYATDAKSGRVTKESILEWFDGSSTKAYLIDAFLKKGTPQAINGYRDSYAKLASPNHGIGPKTCRSILAVLQADDLSNPVCEAVVKRLQATIEKSEVTLVEAV